MLTWPSQNGCPASHSMASYPSSCSCGTYSSVATPPDAPVPRMSTRATM